MLRERSNREKKAGIYVVMFRERHGVRGERAREREINSKKLSEKEEKKKISRSVQSLSPPQ